MSRVVRKRASPLELAFSALAATFASAAAPPARANEPPPPPTVEISNPRVTEGSSGTTPFEATVALAYSTSPLDVDVTAVPGTATTGDYVTAAGTTFQQPIVGVLDYHDKTGTLIFAPGETKKTISVDVNGDTVWERDVAFVVALSNPKGGLLGTASANITLTNDDAPS